MFGVLLTSLGTLFEEIAGSIGKWEVRAGKESLYALAFLNLVWSAVFFWCVAAVKPGLFMFSPASVPTFLARAFLEFAVVHFSLKGLIQAERGAFGFVRTITIPLLLLVDVLAGYALSVGQLVGVGILLAVLAALFFAHGFHAKGSAFVAISAVLAVGTISLYKYNLVHFNSVVGEQLVMNTLLAVYFFAMTWRASGENPLRLFRNRVFAGQSFLQGIGSVAESFAYSFAPASVILTAKRASSVLWAALSGSAVFHERHLALKLMAIPLVLVGLVLLAR